MFGMYGYLVGPIVIYVSGWLGFGALLYTSILKGIASGAIKG